MYGAAAGVLQTSTGGGPPPDQILAAIGVSDGAATTAAVSSTVGVIELLSSTPSDHASTAADPWDATIAIPTGTGRVLLDILMPLDLNTGVTDKLDPGVVDDDLTQQDFVAQGVSRLECWRLLDAAITASGSKILRYDASASTRGFRQIIILRGAAQTISIGKIAASSTSSNINVSVTRASGSFPIGSMVFAFLAGDGAAQTVTVTGDAALVRTLSAPNPDATFYYATGTLATAKATVTVGFDPQFNIVARAEMVVVVEPAP